MTPSQRAISHKVLLVDDDDDDARDMMTATSFTFWLHHITAMLCADVCLLSCWDSTSLGKSLTESANTLGRRNTMRALP